MDKLKFGDFIYKKRKELGLSQEILGHKLGVTNKAVSKWETGETLPDVQLMEHLANALNVTMDELYTQVEIKKQEDKRFNLVLTISIVLSIIVIVLSSILILSHLENKSQQDDNETNIALSLENYRDYISITPCNKSEINDQTLVVYGKIDTSNAIAEFEEVSITLEYNLHFYYETINSSKALYVYINHQIEINVLANTEYFELEFTPTKNIQDFKSFKSFDFSYEVLDISGTLSLIKETQDENK